MLKLALGSQREGCYRSGHLGVFNGSYVKTFTFPSSEFTTAVFKIQPFILKDPKEFFKCNKRVI